MAILASNSSATDNIQELQIKFIFPQYPNQWRIQDFPEEGAPTPRGGGAPTHNLAKFSQKLYEIERIWTPRGEGRASKILLCRSATANGYTKELIFAPYHNL